MSRHTLAYTLGKANTQVSRATRRFVFRKSREPAQQFAVTHWS